MERVKGICFYCKQICYKSKSEKGKVWLTCGHWMFKEDWNWQGVKEREVKRICFDIRKEWNKRPGKKWWDLNELSYWIRLMMKMGMDLDKRVEGSYWEGRDVVVNFLMDKDVKQWKGERARRLKEELKRKLRRIE